MALLKFENVSLRYPIYHAAHMSLRKRILEVGTGGRLAQTGKETYITALDQISFVLKDGDAIGITGHNGAGKTTLLRTMAGIYTPTSGNITRIGSLTSIIEMGSGLDPELSGYENIFRMGMLLGHTKVAIKHMLPEIEQFLDLGDFLYMPVRTYSAGMITRLMFGVATAHPPEILLLDEIFSTGDPAFQKKAMDRMHFLMKQAKIFVLASHDLHLIQSHCKRWFQLSHGKLTEAPLEPTNF